MLSRSNRILNRNFTHNNYSNIIINNNHNNNNNSIIINKLILSSKFHTSSNLKNEIRLGEDPVEYLIKQNQQVKTRIHGSYIFSKILDKKFRLGTNYLYDNPLTNFHAGAKRSAIGFAVIGLFFAHLMDATGIIIPEASILLSVVSLIPFPIVQLLSRPHVSRIYRLYDTSKPQTLENLVDDETLIFQRLDWRGKKTFNELIKVNTLRLPKPEESRFGWVNLVSEDSNTKLIKYFNVTDGIGGINMDRIWSIAEKKSGVDNGRNFFEK
ncbi:hypothetical protein B5S28_g3767 [[Candida] boidinii]|nr:hypothetical protein B5S28_g3767 [[Candida] boidinii]